MTSERTGSGRARPHILAFGGGKGGVGKSVIAANVAIRLARSEHRVVAVDADLGGANLHTILGLTGPRHTLADFLARRVESLADVASPSAVPGLSLVPGSDTPVTLLNPTSAQQARLLRQIARLDADFVVIDLGAGVTVKVLDFFLAAHQGLVVVVPEPTAVENTHHFLRAAFFRNVKRVAQRHGLGKLAEEVARAGDEHGIPGPQTVVDRIWKADPEAGQAIENEIASFAPALIVNRTTSPADVGLGDDLAIVYRDYFRAPIPFLCAIDNDPLVTSSIRQRQAAVETFPECVFSRAIERLTQRLLARSEAPHGG